MKLYYSPLACSLADHIALREAGFMFDLERVDRAPIAPPAARISGLSAPRAMCRL